MGNKLTSSFSNRYKVWCYFGLLRCALWGEGRQILAARLAGPADPTSHPAQQPLCPQEQRPPCLQHSSPHQHPGHTVARILRRMPEEAMEWVVNHPLSWCLLLASVFTKAQPWGCVKRSGYTWQASCAWGRDAVSLLYIRYQVGNEHDRSFLNQASSWSPARRLRYTSPDAARRFSPAPVCPRGWRMPRGFVMRSGPSSAPSVSSPSAHPLVIDSCLEITSQSFCSRGEAALVDFLHGFQQPLVMNVKSLCFAWKELTKPSRGLFVIPPLITSFSPALLNGLRNPQIPVPEGKLSGSAYMQIPHVCNSNCVD